MHLLPNAPLLLAFLAAALVLAVTPGPGVLYVVTRTLAQGRRAGLASVAGVALGNLANAIAAAVGLAALLAASAAAFAIVKYAGAAYLVYLGVQALRAPRRLASGPVPPPDPPSRVLRQGFVVALLNPKTTLFFAAFLPQFIDPQGAATVQAVVLGAIFVGIATCSDTAYVLLARVAAPLLHRARAGVRLGRYAAAGVYFGLGLWTALSTPGAPKPASR